MLSATEEMLEHETLFFDDMTRLRSALQLLAKPPAL
jgi:hypothetical protein